MPTYDYMCSECEHHFEKILKIDDRNLPESECCPNCGKEKTVSLTITTSALVSPFRVDGLKKPSSQFTERMNQIKHGLGKVKHNL